MEFPNPERLLKFSLSKASFSLRLFDHFPVKRLSTLSLNFSTICRLPGESEPRWAALTFPASKSSASVL